MNFFKSHFKFNKQEQSGIFFLLLVITLLQVLYFYVSIGLFEAGPPQVVFNNEEQSVIDALKEGILESRSNTIYPFNPNFITDYKGYVLGMSTDEINRLLHFRSNNNFVNSAEEFQKVTLVSDSLLGALSRYFEFPQWTQNKNGSGFKNSAPEPVISSTHVANTVERKDINSATASDLRAIYGIGDKLSERIIKFRDRLGGFLVDGQLHDVYGLEFDVVQRILERFTVVRKPNVVLIDINNATVEELAELIYIDRNLATRIVKYRESEGIIRSLDELMSIEGFPADRIARIKLYLQL